MSEQDNVNNSDQSNKEQACPQIELLIKYLDSLGIKHSLVTYTRPNKSSTDIVIGSENISTAYILRAVLFKCKKENLYALVITSMKMLIDYVILSREARCDLEYVDITDSPYAAQYDVTFNSYFPMPKYLKVKGILDLRMRNDLPLNSNIFIPTGQSNVLLQLCFDDYLKIHPELKNISFGVYPDEIHSTPDLELSRDNIIKRMNKISLTERRMKERIHETFEMPVMPTMAEKLLKLRIDPAANARSLSILIERDPSLSAQLISWACSPYYGYLGKITSVEDAIIKVLGFDLVMNIALGIAIGQIMNISNEGKLGLLKHWRHSLYTAAFIEILVQKMPVAMRPYKGLAYLCGLLHNFGHLLLGQVFPQQFHILNQMILANPRISILDIEHYLFDTNHQNIGSWLMQLWHMPEELTLAVAHHHDDLGQVNSIYANLVLVTNRLLASKDVGDEFVELDLPIQVIKNIEIPIADINKIFNEFWNNKSGLDNIISSLASV